MRYGLSAASASCSPDPERDAERLAHLVARALVVRVRVGERVSGDRVALQLAEDPAARVPGSGIHEHILEEEDVDAVRRKAGELPDALRELLHRGGSLCHCPLRPGLRVLSGISFGAPSLRSGGQSVLPATRRRSAAAHAALRGTWAHCGRPARRCAFSFGAQRGVAPTSPPPRLSGGWHTAHFARPSAARVRQRKCVTGPAGLGALEPWAKATPTLRPARRALREPPRSPGWASGPSRSSPW